MICILRSLAGRVLIDKFKPTSPSSFIPLNKAVDDTTGAERKYAKSDFTTKVKSRSKLGSEAVFSKLKGTQDGPCLVLALFIFAGGNGVGHNAGAGLQVGSFIFDEHGADNSAGGKITGKVKIEHSAAIEAAARRF
jgi:hypothetical protein